MIGIILSSLIFGLAYRIRGGFADSLVGKLLKKPAGWEIPNNYIRSVWALCVMLALPLSEWSPIIFGLALLGVIPGYFGAEFDLTKKENVSWKNLSLLCARGAFIMLPLAAAFTLLYPWLWLSVLAGSLMPLFYWVGTRLPERKGVITHSQIGEWLIGMSIGAALSIEYL